MAHTAHLADDHHTGEDSGDFNRTLDDGGLVPFLVAGAVLFASLVVGSAASLVFAGSDAVMAAILRGFLSLGMWTLGGFAAAIVAATAVTALRDKRRSLH